MRIGRAAFIGIVAVPLTLWETMCSAASSPETNLHADLKGEYFESSRTLDDATGLVGYSLEVEGVSNVSDRLAARVDGRITNERVGKGGDAVGSLREGYFVIRSENVDVRIGAQIVAWGRADGINPTDNLTPRDYTVLLPYPEDQRFGVTATRVDVAVTDQYSVKWFVTPFFKPSVLPPLSDRFRYTTDRPAHTLENTEVGVKLEKTGGGVDWSLSYFHGFSLTPDGALLTAAGNPPQVKLGYNRINVIGADFAGNIGQLGVRGECAYSSTADLRGTDPSTKNPNWFWVVGVDHPVREDWNVNVQLYGRWVKSFHDPYAIGDPVLRDIAVQNAILDGQQDRISYGWSARIAGNWLNGTLKGEIAYVQNITRQDRYFRVLLSKEVSDHVKLTVGREAFLGSADTFFGSLKRNDNVFLEVRRSF